MGSLPDSLRLLSERRSRHIDSSEMPVFSGQLAFAVNQPACIGLSAVGMVRTTPAAVEPPSDSFALGASIRPTANGAACSTSDAYCRVARLRRGGGMVEQPAQHAPLPYLLTLGGPPVGAGQLRLDRSRAVCPHRGQRADAIRHADAT